MPRWLRVRYGWRVLDIAYRLEYSFLKHTSCIAWHTLIVIGSLPWRVCTRQRWILT
jgi:hypothetical protein